MFFDFLKKHFMTDENKIDLLNEVLYGNKNINEVKYLYLKGKTNFAPDKNYLFINHFKKIARMNNIEIKIEEKKICGAIFSRLDEIDLKINDGKCIIQEKWGVIH